MNIIGIEPGKKGAIVVLNNRGEVVEKEVMPLVGGKLLDFKSVKTMLLANMPCHVFIEDVHAIFGTSKGSTFVLGGICMALEAVVVCCDIPYTKVQPKSWQKIIYQGIPEIRKPSKKISKGKRAGQIVKGSLNTKAMSEVAAKRLFPNEDLRASENCRKPHDGIVDALLIARWGDIFLGAR